MELRGRVKSIVEPHFTAPEKLMILLEKHEEEKGDEGIKIFSVGGEGEEAESTVSAASTRTLSLQRGNKGFGFNTETRKVRSRENPGGGIFKVLQWAHTIFSLYEGEGIILHVVDLV